MRLLLDTHIFLWYVNDSPRLKPSASAAIQSADEVHVSVASLWEIWIKISKGALQRRSLTQLADGSGFQLLAVSERHAEAVATLPRLHKDPFDHMLLAQALVEDLTLVTHDDVLARYGVPVLLV